MARTSRSKKLPPGAVKWIKGSPAYKVFRVVDHIGGMYKVKWVGGSWTYEPVTRIREDLTQEGGEFLFEVCDLWIAAGRVGDFETFYNTLDDSDGMTADEDGLCGFTAVRTAVRLLGDADDVTREVVTRFMETSRAVHRRDVTKGVPFRVLAAFVRFATRAGSRLDSSVFSQNLLTNSITGLDQLLEFPFEDGVYVVGAYNCYKVGHCFALLVKGPNRLLFEEETGVDYLSHAGHWIHNVGFIARAQFN